jgi:hypothetical protein
MQLLATLVLIGTTWTASHVVEDQKYERYVIPK